MNGRIETLIAIIIVMVATVGLNWAVRNLFLARKDAAYQAEHGLNGPRKVVTRGAKRREAFRVVIHTAVVIIAMLLALEFRGLLVFWTVRLALLIAAVLLSIVSILESNDRDELDFELRDREKRL